MHWDAPPAKFSDSIARVLRDFLAALPSFFQLSLELSGDLNRGLYSQAVQFLPSTNARLSIAGSVQHANPTEGGRPTTAFPYYRDIRQITVSSTHLKRIKLLGHTRGDVEVQAGGTELADACRLRGVTLFFKEPDPGWRHTCTSEAHPSPSPP